MSDSLHRRRFEWRQARVAGLIIVGLLLLAYGVYRIGKVFDVFASRYELVMLLPSALGLREGAPVALAGQQIGQVEEIGFIPVRLKTGGNNLFVRIALSEDVRDQIREDSRAVLRTQGLLGDKFVNIEPGSAGAAILEQGDTLEAGQSVDLEEFMTRAAVALDTANAIVADLRDLTHGIEHGEGTIGQLVTDEKLYNRMVRATGQLETMLVGINNGEGALGRLIRDPTLYTRLVSTAARVDSLSAMIVARDGTIGRLLGSDSLYNHILGGVSRADSAITRLDGFVGRATAGDGTLQRLMTDPALYEEFLKAVVDLQSLVRAIREDPSRIGPRITIDVFD